MAAETSAKSSFWSPGGQGGVAGEGNAINREWTRGRDSREEKQFETFQASGTQGSSGGFFLQHSKLQLGWPSGHQVFPEVGEAFEFFLVDLLHDGFVHQREDRLFPREVLVKVVDVSFGFLWEEKRKG